MNRPSDLLIRFMCMAEKHGGSMEIGVTIHDGSWAVCSELLDATAHDWQAVEPHAISEVALRWRERARAYESAQPRSKPERPA